MPIPGARSVAAASTATRLLHTCHHFAQPSGRSNGQWQNQMMKRYGGGDKSAYPGAQRQRAPDSLANARESRQSMWCMFTATTQTSFERTKGGT